MKMKKLLVPDSGPGEFLGKREEFVPILVSLMFVI